MRQIWQVHREDFWLIVAFKGAKMRHLLDSVPHMAMKDQLASMGGDFERDGRSHQTFASYMIIILQGQACQLTDCLRVASLKPAH